jgi:hypothetical protein
LAAETGWSDQVNPSFFRRRQGDQIGQVHWPIGLLFKAHSFFGNMKLPNNVTFLGYFLIGHFLPKYSVTKRGLL